MKSFKIQLRNSLYTIRGITLLAVFFIFLGKIHLEALTINIPTSTTSATSSIATFEEEVLAIATTSYKGSSADRVTNIKLGVKRLQGDYIAPGEEFSLLAHLRPFSEEAGFKKEHVIGATSSPMELGGGLCQVSTTLFRAALKAGLPITERHNHSYVVGYYGAGLDATVYFPRTDLRFKNDYAYPIRIEGSVKNNILTITLYGRKDGRVASTTDIIATNIKPKPKTKYIPSTAIAVGETKCTETARRGMTTDVTYIVTYPEKKNEGIDMATFFGGTSTIMSATTTSKRFLSVYRPWAAVCYVGTSTSPVSVAPSTSSL